MARLLLIEPDSVLARSYQQALQRAGHSVDVARSAQQAVDAADDHRPDIILLELQLPGHNGIEFLYELRSYPEWQAIPVIVLSNVPPNEVGAEEAARQQLGIVEYHYKPHTTLAQLIGAVNALIVTAKA